MSYTAIFENGAYRLQHVVPVEEQKEFQAGLYRYAQDMNGNSLYIPQKASDESVVDTGSAVAGITQDIGAFLKVKDRYDALKLPHKRGYLLHGEPGCGKSSLIRLIARRFVDDLGGIVVDLQGYTPRNAYEDVRSHGIGTPLLFVIEDVDNITRGGSAEFALLDFLDGMKKIENVVVVMTTNYIERIPARVRARPSRVDRLFKVTRPSQNDRKAYLAALGITDEKTLTEMVEYSADMTFAQVKELFISSQLYGSDLKDVAARIKESQVEEVSLEQQIVNAIAKNVGAEMLKASASTKARMA